MYIQSTMGEIGCQDWPFSTHYCMDNVTLTLVKIFSRKLLRRIILRNIFEEEQACDD